MTIYLPKINILIFDKNDYSLLLREVVYPNVAKATLSTDKKGKRVISIHGGESLIFDKLDYEDGEYNFILNQSGLKVAYGRTKKVKGETKIQPSSWRS